MIGIGPDRIVAHLVAGAAGEGPVLCHKSDIDAARHFLDGCEHAVVSTVHGYAQTHEVTNRTPAEAGCRNISNGAMIAATLRAGFKLGRRDDPDVLVNFSTQSMAMLMAGSSTTLRHHMA